MTFVTYAQNFEDVILNRALSHIENGFYIDVGANDPVEDSVTKSFYERGWSGINIEPLKEHIDALASDRPRDINLQIAVGNQEGEIEIWNPGVRGWSTAYVEVAESLRNAGHKLEKTLVPIRPLNAIWGEYVRTEVHFLKVDVEGFESSVLESLDFQKCRPWIVVVEAFNSTSEKPDYELWENLLTNAGYDFAYFDGLNRFYVAQEHKEISDRLCLPPNVLDDFVRYDVLKLHEEMRKLHEEMRKKDETIAELEKMNNQLMSNLAKLSERIDGLEYHMKEAKIGENFIQLDARISKAENSLQTMAILEANLKDVQDLLSRSFVLPIRKAAKKDSD